MPVCSVCGNDKAQELFEKDKRKKSGYRKRCHTCAHDYKMQWAKDSNIAEKRKGYFDAYNATEIANERKKKWKAENHEKNLAINQSWRDRNKEHTRAYYQANKEKHNKRMSIYYQNNKEAHLEQTRSWRLANPEKNRIHHQNRKRRKYGGKLSIDLIQRLMAEQNRLCIYCKTDLTISGFHLDHRMPLARGGKHEDGNMQLLCPTCNVRKHDMLPDEFSRRMGLKNGTDIFAVCK